MTAHTAFMKLLLRTVKLKTCWSLSLNCWNKSKSTLTTVPHLLHVWVSEFIRRGSPYEGISLIRHMGLRSAPLFDDIKQSLAVASQSIPSLRGFGTTKGCQSIFVFLDRSSMTQTPQAAMWTSPQLRPLVLLAMFPPAASMAYCSSDLWHAC